MTRGANQTPSSLPLAALFTVLVLSGAGCDNGGGSSDTNTTGDGEAICSEIGTAINIGVTCNEVPYDTDCGAGGLCLDFGTGPVCWQACVPGVCASLCTVEAESCLAVTDPAGNPQELQPGVPMGVCGVSPTGTQGLYDPCGTDLTGNCQEGFTCLTITAATGSEAFCAPECGPSSPCPELEGVAGQCVLTSGGAEPTNCALLCTPPDGTCPTGMTCFDLGSGGACLWPST
jgi:hypothetical protein